MTPYHEALTKNRDELVALNKGLAQMIAKREMEIVSATNEIALLNKARGAHAELITQIDLELNRKASA